MSKTNPTWNWMWTQILWKDNPSSCSTGGTHHIWLRPSGLFCRTNIMHMTTFILMMFKIILFWIITLLAMLYERVRILLICGKHLHHCTISLREEFWPIKLFDPATSYWSACVMTGKWAVMYIVQKQCICVF